MDGWASPSMSIAWKALISNEPRAHWYTSMNSPFHVGPVLPRMSLIMAVIISVAAVMMKVGRLSRYQMVFRVVSE